MAIRAETEKDVLFVAVKGWERQRSRERYRKTCS